MKRALQICLGIMSLLLLIAGIRFLFWATLPLATRLIVAVLMVIDSIMYLSIAQVMEKRGFIIKVGVIGFIGANLLLTLMDNMGMVDFAVVGLNISILYLYIRVSGNSQVSQDVK